jgi:hypothetical protein
MSISVYLSIVTLYLQAMRNSVLQPKWCNNLINSSFRATLFHILIGNIKFVSACAFKTFKQKREHALPTASHFQASPVGREWSLERALNRTVFTSSKKRFKSKEFRILCLSLVWEFPLWQSDGKWRATAQAVSRRPVTSEAWVRSRGRSMWDLWWTKWHWDRFFPEYFGFPLSISFHRCSITWQNDKKLIIFLFIFIIGLHNKP